MYPEKLEALQTELINRGILSIAKLAEIKSALISDGGTFTDHLLKSELIQEETLYKTLADILNLPYINLGEFNIDSDIIKLFPASLAKQYKVIPLFQIGKTLTVTMTDPTDITAIDRIQSSIGMDIDSCISTESDINTALEQHYGVSSSVANLMDSLLPDEKEDETVNSLQASLDDSLMTDQPVIKLVNLIILQGIRENASDIHIEPTEKDLGIRLRVDGILHPITSPPKRLQNELIARIKVMSNMDITEARLPQDGRFTFSDNDMKIDVRVSTVPSVQGEHIVMRLLNTGKLNVGLSNLGFSKDMLTLYKRFIKKPYGMILVTGPTGSGKTTTLYSTLSEISSVEKNIVTIEDPVEYRLNRIRQIQVNPRIGLNFASGLRSIVRQDPDIIFVGEIRDKETAEIAIQSALTGHLVFSTLHTNDAAGAISRLNEMGIEPFLISSSVIAVLAQRLVRKVCQNCKESVKITKEDEKLGLPAGQPYVKGKGCSICLNTGYKGRIGIFELLEINSNIHEAIINKSSSSTIKKLAIEAGMVTLREDGLQKVISKQTTPEEVLKSTEIPVE